MEQDFGSGSPRNGFNQGTAVLKPESIGVKYRVGLSPFREITMLDFYAV
ncbi:hypothetical protein QR68_07430 [Dickeya fangzhongdai]|nr:hypothetical protein [Dickeya fangzhongdai]UGA52447.1 hypothetical protein QR68_07430 [Dickeya fangzhongdai]